MGPYLVSSQSIVFILQKFLYSGKSDDRKILEPLKALLLFLAGVLAGFINVNAGGGSFLTLPLLIFLGGYSSTIANGTNRIAVFVMNLVSAGRFRQYGFKNLRQGLKIGATAVVGSIIGARIAIEVPDNLFKVIFSVIMILALFVIIRKPGKRETETRDVPRYPVLQYFIFFFIGIYGGFLQAGTGFLIIFSLTVIGGLSLLKTNSLKMIVVAAYILPSIVIFAVAGKVEWIPALILSCGTSIGAILGTAFAVKQGDKWIKVILACAIVGMALKLLGVF